MQVRGKGGCPFQIHTVAILAIGKNLPVQELVQARQGFLLSRGKEWADLKAGERF